MQIDDLKTTGLKKGVPKREKDDGVFICVATFFYHPKV